MDFQELTPEPETNINKPTSSFQTKKRLWTVAITSLIGISLIAACIKAIEPSAPPQSTTSTNSIAANTPTTVQAVADAPTATVIVTTTEATTAPVADSTAVSVTTTVSETAVVSTTATVSSTQTTVTTTTGAPQQPVVASGDYNGIPVGFTAEGYPFRGSPDAPVTVYEYSDYQCPFCSRYFVQTEPAINESFVRSGKLRVVFRDFPLVELHPNAPAAHKAATCIAEQGAPLYWAMHDQLFRSQDEWARLPDPLPVFSRIVNELVTGESKADAVVYESCMTEGATTTIVDAGVNEAFSIGFSGTPSFRFVNNANSESYDLIGAQPYDQFAAFIDAMAAGQAPANAQAQQSDPSGGSGDGGTPFWATAEGLKPDPDRPGINMAGDYYRGDLNATVTVIEFSDFQCPYCRRHVSDTQPTLDEQFVDTGKVLWVFKNFPLSIHPQAPAAAVAAECAGDQGKFWEMGELLFRDPDSWSFDPPTAIFSGYAQQLGLDAILFDACQQGTDASQRVQDDMNDGSALVRGTPSFIILKEGQGRIIPGALPTEQFVAALEDVVANGFSQ